MLSCLLFLLWKWNNIDLFQFEFVVFLKLFKYADAHQMMANIDTYCPLWIVNICEMAKIIC